MGRQRGPSAFSDSPEDLIRRAEDMVEDQNFDLPNVTSQLLTDLSRALEKERLDRVSYTNMMREALSEATRSSKEVERLRTLVAHPFRNAARALVDGARRRVPLAYAVELLGILSEKLGTEVDDGG